MSVLYQRLSSLSACISLTSWLCAQLPQVIENHHMKSAAGLSLSFLTVWLAGDLTNLIGCILTKQLLFQTLLACYYTVIDLILLSQYFYYTKYAPNYVHWSRVPYGSVPSLPSPTVLSPRPASFHKSTSVVSVIALSRSVSALAASHSSANSDPVQVLGTTIAWVCTALYLCSRIPQIIHNFKRKSTRGLSPLLFAAAMTGNFTYTLSILFSVPSMPQAERAPFLMRELPYLLGSAGTVGFDITILTQTWAYRNRPPLKSSEMSELLNE
ncbi:hypothetical protein CANCADRAFT_26327 [Tortispora caseinolytica NRRL Y-17796]|uniref:Uncharacterized protein n=1 Tax=Tortispora caseinolytica NRRL Y-17796 TaxID=767744 RepID=A0A1E4THT1_9ASCO|nr:hypothetical protein CANCADRAFT_26327 [Tortispora caseinolytica NRRL Y-17796]